MSSLSRSEHWLANDEGGSAVWALPRSVLAYFAACLILPLVAVGVLGVHHWPQLEPAARSFLAGVRSGAGLAKQGLPARTNAEAASVLTSTPAAEVAPHAPAEDDAGNPRDPVGVLCLVPNMESLPEALIVSHAERSAWVERVRAERAARVARRVEIETGLLRQGVIDERLINQAAVGALREMRATGVISTVRPRGS